MNWEVKFYRLFFDLQYFISSISYKNLDFRIAKCYGDWTEHTDTQHKHTCECGEVEYANHEWNEGVVTKQPTHLEEGEKTYTCTDCDKTKVEKVDKLTAHTYGDWTVVTEATETTEGKKERTCTICGEVESQSIPMLTTVAGCTAAIGAPTAHGVVALLGAWAVVRKKED